MMKYYKTTGLDENIILRNNNLMEFFNKDTKKWEYSFEWFDKVNFSDFTDYVEINEKEAMDFIKEYRC
nr:MAG TPA: hypothetical protein [Caudoviricetes sp.]